MMKFIKEHSIFILLVAFFVAFFVIVERDLFGIVEKYFPHIGEMQFNPYQYYSASFFATISLYLNKNLFKQDLSKTQLFILSIIFFSILGYIFSTRNFHQAVPEFIFTIGVVFAGNAIVNIEKIGNTEKHTK